MPRPSSGGARPPRQGNADAQLKLGWWLLKGQDVVKQDEAAGMNWLLMAANQGEPQAQYEVGIGYWKGRGVKPDPIAAYMWLDLCRDRAWLRQCRQLSSTKSPRP